MDASFVFSDENVKFLMMPDLAQAHIKDLALKAFSNNIVELPLTFTPDFAANNTVVRTINSDGVAEFDIAGQGYLYFPVNNNTYQPGDSFSFSIEVKSSDFSYNDFGFLWSEASIQFAEFDIPSGEWTRISAILKIKPTEPLGTLLPFVRVYSGTPNIQVRKPMIRKLLPANLRNFDYDFLQQSKAIDDSNATSIAEIEDDFNNLLSSLRAAKLLAE